LEGIVGIDIIGGFPVRFESRELVKINVQEVGPEL
jgi:hypothetical protein